MWERIFEVENGKEHFPNLHALVNVVRSLPASNADSERAFSFVTAAASANKGNLSVESIKGQVILKFNMVNRDEKPENMIITQRMIDLFNEKMYRPYKQPEEKDDTIACRY